MLHNGLAPKQADRSEADELHRTPVTFLVMGRAFTLRARSTTSFSNWFPPWSHRGWIVMSVCLWAGAARSYPC